MTENIKQKNNAGVDWGQAIQKVLSVPAIGPLVALIAAVLFFYSQNERFLSLNTISIILNQNAWIAVLAIGQTIIIFTAGIDLSNGAAMALGMIVTAFLAVEFEVPPELVPLLGEQIDPLLALLTGFAVSIGFGVFNGLLVTQLNLPPFIVTLGTLNIAFAMTRLISSTIINPLPDLLTFFGNNFSFSDLTPDGIEPSIIGMMGEQILNTRFAYGIVAMLVLYFITWIMMRETDFGRHVYAIGDDPEAARLMGIPVNRTLILVYGLAGLTYALAGWLYLGRLGSGDPNVVAGTANLDTITAVVIGGTSLFGGRGNIFGTLIGALIVGVFITGLQSIGVPILYQRLITGILVILAVALDQFSQRMR